MIPKKNTAVRLMLTYITLTGGLWMFIFSYANSYNRLSEEKIPPARLTVSDSSARLDILGQALTFDTSVFSEGSRSTFAAYLLSPDEVRLLVPVIYSLFMP
ncbi:MAG: hypothetical protein J6P14_03520 [Ruminococcus sp.]|nr:hypothetical protein [Ruminococcus sp.]